MSITSEGKGKSLIPPPERKNSHRRTSSEPKSSRDSENASGSKGSPDIDLLNFGSEELSVSATAIAFDPMTQVRSVWTSLMLLVN